MSTETETPPIGTLVRKDPDQNEEQFREELENGLATQFESDAIIDYALKLTARTSPQQIACKLFAYKQYEACLAVESISVQEADSADIRMFIDSRARKGDCIGTLDNTIGKISALYTHLEDEWGIRKPKIEIKGEDYAAKVPRDTERRAVSRETVRQVIQAADGLRNTLIVAMFYFTALRRAELSDLDVENVDRERRLVEVTDGKYSKPRKVPYSEELDRLLDRWIDRVRPDYVCGERPALFVGKNGLSKGTRLKAGGCYRAVMSAADRSGLQEVERVSGHGNNIYRIKPHVLRHSLATHLVEDGVPLRYIQRILGHSSVETTLRYAKEAEEKVHRSYHSDFTGL